MQNILSLIIIIGAIVIAPIILFTIFIRSKNQMVNQVVALQNTLQSNELIIDEFKFTLARQQNETEEKQQKLEDWQLESRQVSQQLEHRIKGLQQQLAAQQTLIAQIQQQQPEDKLYSRAQKMVQLGADVEELVNECQLPKAEAEMLVAMQNKK